MKPLDIKIGDKFGRLTVVQVIDCPAKYANPAKHRPGQRTVKVQCDCGTDPYFTLLNSLRRGNTRSCGCLRRETTSGNNLLKKTHGMRKHVLYAAWVNMRARCLNPANPGWANYGGRGIKIHPAWDSFAQYVADVEGEIGPRPPGMSLDRADNDGNYEPGNIRWATDLEQVRNRRTIRELTERVRDLEAQLAVLREENAALRQAADRAG